MDKQRCAQPNLIRLRRHIEKMQGLLRCIAGIRGREHEVKADELGTNKNLSRFDLCGCKDGRVVIKAHGCKGPVITVTNYRWK